MTTVISPTAIAPSPIRNIPIANHYPAGGPPTRASRRPGRIDRINLIDFAIVIAVLFALGNGYQRGLPLSLAQYLGLLVGVIVGAAIAPFLADLLGIRGPLTRPLTGVVILFAAGSIGSSAGYWLGEPLRLASLRKPGGGRFDGVGGAAFSMLAVLSVCWFLGVSFSRGPSPDVARLIQRSTILRFLDGALPPTPSFLAGVQQVLAGVPFPSAFAGLEPDLPGSLPLPPTIDTPGLRRAQIATVKVVSDGVGCSGKVSGSGFPVAGNHILTNAHVVAGTRNTVVVATDGRVLPATVVLFDASRDVAILNVPRLELAALGTRDGSRGSQGAVIGYPGGNAETASPAVVDGVVMAEGRDIYNDRLVTRQILIVEAIVLPGNSGGPLVDTDGDALGVIFAASTSGGQQAYALSIAEVTPDIEAAIGRSAPADTGSRCAV